MDLRRILASVLAVSSVYVLWGLGPALGASAILVFASPRMEAVRYKAFIARARTHVRRGWTWVRAQPQPTWRLAMFAALALIGVGVALAVHPGWGIAAFGFGLGGLSLMADLAG